MTEGILQIAHKAAEDLRTLQKTRDFEYPGFFGFVERLPPAMRVRRKKLYLSVEKKNLQ